MAGGRNHYRESRDSPSGCLMKSAPDQSADSDNEPSLVVINVTPLVRMADGLWITRHLGCFAFLAFWFAALSQVDNFNIVASHRGLSPVLYGYLIWSLAVAGFYKDNECRNVYGACVLVNLFLVLPWFDVPPGAPTVSKVSAWLAGVTIALFLLDVAISYSYQKRAIKISKLAGYYCPPATGPRNLPVRWGLRSIMFIGLGVLLAASVLIINVLSSFAFLPRWLPNVFINHTIPFLVIGCFFCARRWRVQSAETALEKDPRRPVLILRSFVFDSQLSYVPTEGGDHIFENVLSSELSTFGPLIALRNQKMRAPFAGIATELVDNDNWKEKVMVYLEKAGLIVLLAGDSPSFRWELEQVIQNGLLPRTILIFPPYARHLVLSNVFEPFPTPGRLDHYESWQPREIPLLIRWSMKNDLVAFKADSPNAPSAGPLALRHSVTISAPFVKPRRTKKRRGSRHSALPCLIGCGCRHLHGQLGVPFGTRRNSTCSNHAGCLGRCVVG